MFEIGNSIETVDYSGWGEEEVIINGKAVFLEDDENILKLVPMVEHLCEYTTSHRAVHFKRENFIVYELYLNKSY